MSPVEEYTVNIATKHGEMPVFVTRPQSPHPLPAIIFYMDIFGPREELFEMCRRFASNGFVALLPQLFYRQGDFSCHPTQRTDLELQKATELNHATTNTLVASDTGVLIDFLHISEKVEPHRIGTIGTCMGARHALIAAAEYPENIHAFVSLHGGRMMTEATDSPHLYLDRLQAPGYIAWAADDAITYSNQVQYYRDAFAHREVAEQVDVLSHTQHGYFFPERPQYHKEAAEKAWAKSFELFSNL